MQQLPLVLVFDNDDLANPHRKIAVIERGPGELSVEPAPAWFAELL